MVYRMLVDNETLKYLPYSGRRYVVGRDGVVYNSSGSVIESKVTELGTVVELEWLDGVGVYSVGMLVIVCFHPMYLPEHLWKEIEPLYLDDDFENNRSENLTYRFRCGLLEYERVPGFYYIPHYTKYVLSRHGQMLTAETKLLKGWQQTKPDLIRNSKGGYWSTRVINVPGISSVLLRHRALCLTFKSFEPADTVNGVVNHIDGIPGSDDLDNLEWSTYAKNNQHAHDTGLTGKRRVPVLVKNLKTNEIVSYNGSVATAKALGYSNTAPVRFRLRHHPDTLFEDYLQLKLDNGSTWPTVDTTGVPQKCYIGTMMAFRSVFTGKVVTFSTFDEGSKLSGVDKQTIMIHIRDGQIMPFKGYNFGYYTQGMEWPEHSDRHLKAYRSYPVRTPDPVIVTDTVTGEELFFESRNELAAHFEISQSYATQLVLNGWMYNNRYLSRYYDLREHIKVPSSWKAWV